MERSVLVAAETERARGQTFGCGYATLCLCGESPRSPGLEFRVWGSAFAGRCGWRHATFTINLTPNLNAF
jgi:hypothetical protein